MKNVDLTPYISNIYLSEFAWFDSRNQRTTTEDIYPMITGQDLFEEIQSFIRPELRRMKDVKLAIKFEISKKPNTIQ